MKCIFKDVDLNKSLFSNEKHFIVHDKNELFFVTLLSVNKYFAKMKKLMMKIDKIENETQNNN